MAEMQAYAIRLGDEGQENFLSDGEPDAPLPHCTRSGQRASLTNTSPAELHTRAKDLTIQGARS
jgi:hypothetical protein